MTCWNIMHCMHRRRVVQVDDLDTQLKRCLSTIELSFIGLSMMASGIFVVTSTVINLIAGPGIVLSYLLSGTAAVLSALSYAEMGSRIPRTGSSYIFVSVSLGEIWGFLAGWNMILEYVLISAAMGRCFTSTLILAAGGENVTMEIRETISWEFLGQHTDLISALVVLLFACVVGLGVRLTSVINVAFNVIGMALVLIVSGISISSGNIENWDKHGLETFFPYGVGGVISGAATCYFSYIGFECITVSGEESTNPKKAVPRAILLAFAMASFCYVFTALSLTYYTPLSNFIPSMPLANIFLDHGFVAKAITVSVGAVLSVSTNVITGLYAIPRVFYAMACDGLIFQFFGRVNRYTQTPINAMIVSGLMVGLVTFLLDMATLVAAVSIGTISSYVLVALGAMMLRYEPLTGSKMKKGGPGEMSIELEDVGPKYRIDHKGRIVRPGDRKQWVREHWFFETFWPDVKPKVAIPLMTFCIFMLTGVETIAMRLHMFFETWNIVLGSVLVLPVVFWVLHLLLYEQNEPDDGCFRMPLMPLVPTLSVLLNIQFMLMLDWFTWVRLVVWVTVGFIIYFTYGLKHSNNTGTSLLDDPLNPRFVNPNNNKQFDPNEDGRGETKPLVSK